SQASTSVMADEIVGLPVTEAFAKLAEFEKMITSRGNLEAERTPIATVTPLAVSPSTPPRRNAPRRDGKPSRPPRSTQALPRPSSPKTLSDHPITNNPPFLSRHLKPNPKARKAMSEQNPSSPEMDPSPLNEVPEPPANPSQEDLERYGKIEE